mgnify:CR=1 FL=1
MLEVIDKKDVGLELKRDWWKLLEDKIRKNKSVIEVSYFYKKYLRLNDF